MNLTPKPREIDSPSSLMLDLLKLRTEFLVNNDFGNAILLTHVHAWLYWIDQNWNELSK